MLTPLIKSYLKKPLYYLQKNFNKTLYRGTGFYCPVCESSLRLFLPHGRIPRPNARCPVCGSVERHRMIWLYFMNETNLFSSESKRMLHIAPEKCFSERLENRDQINYLTADLSRSAMVKMDITDIQYPDNSFDVIYCSHVLEHIPDDRKAMRELARVLKPNGWAILQVPIEAEKTFEDLSITDPEERDRLFGHPEHVRVYGLDYKNRLEMEGFQVNVVSYLEKLEAQQRYRYGLNINKDDIYFCQVQSS